MKSTEMRFVVCSMVLNLFVVGAAPAQTEAMKKTSATRSHQATGQRTPFSSSPFYIESELEKIVKQITPLESDQRILKALQQEAKFEAERIVELRECLRSDGGLMQEDETLRSDLHRFAAAHGKHSQHESATAKGEIDEEGGSLSAVILFRRYQALQAEFNSIDSTAREIESSIKSMDKEIEGFIRVRESRRSVANEANDEPNPDAANYRRAEDNYDYGDGPPMSVSPAPTMSTNGPGDAVPDNGLKTNAQSEGNDEKRGSLDPMEIEKLAAGLRPDNEDETINILFRVNVELQQKGHELVRKITSLDREANRVERRITRYVEETEAALSEATSIRDGLDLDRQAAQLALTRQARLNPLLVTAIVLMIVAMVALYYSLNWFRSEFAERLIKQRVLIELLSMSFLLLTVIILGSVRMLDSTALAALLGTMAGYILARKPKRKVADEAEEDDPDAPEDGI